MCRVTDQVCSCTAVVLLYCSDCILHRSCLEVLDEVKVKRRVGAVRHDGDVCHVCTDEQPCHERADALAQPRKLAGPVLRLVDHDHQVQRR